MSRRACAAGGYLKGLGATRDNCDVAMPGHHPYVVKGERVAAIVWRKT